LSKHERYTKPFASAYKDSAILVSKHMLFA